MSQQTLFLRRLAHRALVLVMKHYELEEIGMRFNPDDPSQIMPGPDGSLRFAEDWRSRAGDGLAWCWLMIEGDEPKARVVIPRVRALVRPTHRRDFDPWAVGIQSGRALDVDTEIDLTDWLTEDGGLLRDAPQRYQARPDPRNRRSFKVKRALKGCP